MLKKISFVKLKDRISKKSKNKVKLKGEDKQTDDTKVDEEYGGPPDEEGGTKSQQFDVNYDRLSTNSETVAANGQESNQFIKYPTILLQSFRKKFKKNKTKQKVNKISEMNKTKPELSYQTIEDKTEDKRNSIEINLSDDSKQENKSTESLSLNVANNSSVDLNVYTEQTSLDGNSDDNSSQTKGKPIKKFSLVEEIERIVGNGWYWGPITRKEAEDKLRDQTDGSFLVRDSSDDHYLFSLSFRSFGRTLHTRIEYTNGLFSFYSNGSTDGNSSLIDLIQHSMANSEKGVFCYSRGRSPVSPSFPVRLTRPVSRFSEVRSLQYLCKFVIRQSTSFSQIQSLPLPKSIKGFIENTIY